MRRTPDFGGVVSLSLIKGKLFNDELLSKLKEPRGIDFLNNKLAVSSEEKVFIITDKVQVLENDYFSYIHTVSFCPFDDNRLMVSSSGFDCIFEYDLKESNLIWEWFAWENGFDRGKDPTTHSDVLLTRHKDQAKKWQQEWAYSGIIPHCSWKDKSLASLANMAMVRRQLRRLGNNLTTLRNPSPLWSLILDMLHRKKMTKRDVG